MACPVTTATFATPFQVGLVTMPPGVVLTTDALPGTTAMPVPNLKRIGQVIARGTGAGVADGHVIGDRQAAVAVLDRRPDEGLGHGQDRERGTRRGVRGRAADGSADGLERAAGAQPVVTPGDSSRVAEAGAGLTAGQGAVGRRRRGAGPRRWPRPRSRGRRGCVEAGQGDAADDGRLGGAVPRRVGCPGAGRRRRDARRQDGHTRAEPERVGRGRSEQRPHRRWRHPGRSGWSRCRCRWRPGCPPAAWTWSAARTAHNRLLAW